MDDLLHEYRHVAVHEAKAKLSELLQAVEDGEEIVITNRGKPVAKLTHPLGKREKLEPGFARPAMLAAGFTDEDVARALEPMSDEALKEWGID